MYHVFEWRLWEVPLDVDAVTSPRYTREPLSLSLHLIEVSHISIRKSSITLRCFNMSACLLTKHRRKDTTFPQITQQNAVKVSKSDEIWMTCYGLGRRIWINWGYCMHYDDATERREEASASKSWNAERKDEVHTGTCNP